ARVGVGRCKVEDVTAGQARLLAERDDAEAIVFPAPLTARRDEPSVATAIAGEEKLFESRTSARRGQRSQLHERVAQTNEEIRGLSAQLAAKETELELVAKELAGGPELYPKNLVSIPRYSQLQ